MQVQFDPNIFSANAIRHNGRPVLMIGFPYDQHLIAQIKTIPSAKWSSTHKSWYVTDNPDNRFSIPYRMCYQYPLPQYQGRSDQSPRTL
jgi:hypothetical protein